MSTKEVEVHSEASKTSKGKTKDILTLRMQVSELGLPERTEMEIRADGSQASLKSRKDLSYSTITSTIVNGLSLRMPVTIGS